MQGARPFPTTHIRKTQHMPPSQPIRGPSHQVRRRLQPADYLPLHRGLVTQVDEILDKEATIDGLSWNATKEGRVDFREKDRQGPRS